MSQHTFDFFQKAASDINIKEKREGQLIFSPHWYAFCFAIAVFFSVAVIYIFRASIPLMFIVGSFPFYIIAIIYTFETKCSYDSYSADFLNHKIMRKHLAHFYQSLNKEEKAKFRELILTKKSNITYTDLKNLNNS